MPPSFFKLTQVAWPILENTLVIQHFFQQIQYTHFWIGIEFDGFLWITYFSTSLPSVSTVFTCIYLHAMDTRGGWTLYNAITQNRIIRFSLSADLTWLLDWLVNSEAREKSKKSPEFSGCTLAKRYRLENVQGYRVYFISSDFLLSCLFYAYKACWDLCLFCTLVAARSLVFSFLMERICHIPWPTGVSGKK